MEEKFEVKFQIGKSGITAGTIESFKLAFKTHRQLRISVLKSAGRDRNSTREMASKIQEKLGFPTGSRIIGFTIILVRLKKLRK